MQDEPIGLAISGLIGDVVTDIIESIGQEIGAAANDPSSTIELRFGRPTGSAGPDRLWSFEFDGGISIPPETPAQLEISGEDPVAVTVLAIGELDLVLGVREELGESISRAKLIVNPWFIYDHLRQRLNEFAGRAVDTSLAEALIDLADLDEVAESPPAPTAIASDEDVDEVAGRGQQQAIAASTLPGLRFVWGPPGTGKTRTLAGAVAAITARGERVMVLAHSNAAVDVAMVRVADELADTELLANGQVLRVGVAQSDEARACVDILPDEIIRRSEPELLQRYDRVDAERRRLSGQLNRATSQTEHSALGHRLESVREELAEIERQLREARSTLIRNAQVVGATLSKHVIDDLLWRWQPDYVIVDEASMAGFPFLIAIALQRPTGLACYGDFRQLPPIAVSESPGPQQWFGKDVFEHAGVISRIEAGEHDPRLSTLRLQFRMGSDIADLVGSLAYFSMLRTHESAERRARSISQLDPAADAQIVIVDTTDLESVCLQDAAVGSYSRFNPLSAAIAASLADNLLDAGAESIGIISPYRAQAQLLRSLFRGHDRVTPATAHKFQGSERDVMIVDLTDALPQSGPSRLTGRDEDLSLRLLNVSISRAKGKLVVLLDKSFAREHHAPSSVVNRLVSLAEDLGVSVLGSSDLQLTSQRFVQFNSWADGARAALDGVADAALRFDVSIPGLEFDGPWLDHLVSLGSRARYRLPAQVASRIDSSSLDIRFKTLGAAPLMMIGTDQCLIGGRTPSSPTVLLNGTETIAVLRRLLVPTE